MNLFLTILLACGDKTSDTSQTDTDTSSHTSSNHYGDCTPLTEEECVTMAACTPLLAMPLTYNEEDTCWEQGERAFTECISTDVGCGAVITYARPNPDAACMMFDSSCIPLEWDICDEINFAECPS